MTNSLANLDIAIGFLVSVGGQPESLLMAFMKDTLEMKADSIHSAQVILLSTFKLKIKSMLFHTCTRHVSRLRNFLAEPTVTSYVANCHSLGS